MFATIIGAGLTELPGKTPLAPPPATPQPTASSTPIDRAESDAQVYEVTAYSVGDDFTPNHGITASGRRVKDGVTAACAREIPFGTRVDIEGVGQRTCYDRGGRITRGKIDVFMANKSEALAFGRRKLRVKILN